MCDPYHAGLLHQFAATFGLFRTTQAGGTILDRRARHMINYSIFDSDDEAESKSHYEDVSGFDTSLRLQDGSVVDFRDETGDGDAINVMAIYPNFVVSRIVNTLSTRQIRPKGPDEFELYWTCFGYADDDAELRDMRIKQANIIGPAGFITMEDAESGVLVQRATRGAQAQCSTLQMGGLGAIESQDHQVTEVPIRGLAHLLRAHGHRGREPEHVTTDAQKLRITELLYDYVQALDDDRLEAWPDFFVADCQYKIMPRENVKRALPLPIWYCDNQRMLHDRVRALRTSQVYNLHYDRHLLSNVRIHEEDDGVHPVRANWAVFQTDVVEGTTSLFAPAATPIRWFSSRASRSSNRNSWCWTPTRSRIFSPPRSEGADRQGRSGLISPI